MPKSTINATQKKKRGRPANPAGRRISIPISFAPGLVAELDAYAEKAGMTRSEAVRQFVESGLQAKAKGKR